MKPIYTKETSSFGTEIIRATYEDGVQIVIPTDPANSDYQRYLKSLKEN